MQCSPTGWLVRAERGSSNRLIGIVIHRRMCYTTCMGSLAATRPPTLPLQRKKMTQKERHKKWRSNLTPEKKEQIRLENCVRTKKAYHRNPDVKKRQQENFKKYYDTNPEFRERVVRSASLGRYKMTPEEYDKQLADQGGHCVLCESTDGDAGRRLHVDHDHACCDIGSAGRTCGKCNRGILCGPCNRRLGGLELVLKEALVYPFPTLIGTPESWTGRAMRYLKRYSRVQS